MLPNANAVGNDGSARNCRRLVAEPKTLWRGEYHRGRRPAAWSPGEYLVIDRAQAGPGCPCSARCWCSPGAASSRSPPTRRHRTGPRRSRLRLRPAPANLPSAQSRQLPRPQGCETRRVRDETRRHTLGRSGQRVVPWGVSFLNKRDTVDNETWSAEASAVGSRRSRKVGCLLGEGGMRGGVGLGRLDRWWRDAAGWR